MAFTRGDYVSSALSLTACVTAMFATLPFFAQRGLKVMAIASIAGGILNFNNLAAVIIGASKSAISCVIGAIAGKCSPPNLL